jgi:hypothetical protein
MYDVLYKRLSLSPGIPLPNPSESYWAFPPAPIQKQGAEESAALPEYADVVIIGSGITGTSFAREFLDHVNYREKEGGRRFKVVMLEARDACSGGTARWVRLPKRDTRLDYTVHPAGMEDTLPHQFSMITPNWSKDTVLLHNSSSVSG